MNFNKSLVALLVSVTLAGCSLDGDDGAQGPAGANGANGTDGTNGTDGSNGLNSLISQTVLAVDDANCPNGGTRIDSGLDSNQNDVLDSSEITETSYVCTPVVINASASELNNNVTNDWYRDAEVKLEQAKDNWLAATGSSTTNKVVVTNKNGASQLMSLESLKGKAKNVILFVGDGMGVSTVTAARILEGQQKGMQGEEHSLSFGEFPFVGFTKTYNVDAQTPDSAGTMTAMMSGVKTDVGVIGVNENIERGNCGTVAGNELVTALELAEIAGKSTGIISTARITHATPAATYAKSADRNWEDISDMKIDENPERANCEDIASQLVNFEANVEQRFAGVDIDGIEVVMGGGRRHFLPKDASFNSPDAVSEKEGDRTDGRDLTAEWKQKYSDGSYVYDQAGFDAVDTETTPHLFGLFNESHMQYEADRGNDVAGEPSIAQMTEKAIKILDNNDQGFFLMVESGRIDHGHHAGSAYNALTDTIAFSDAIAKARELTNDEDTLILVTADHSHVFTIAGYPKRGNPILGKVVNVGQAEPAMASDDMPYTTLGYTNGRGFRDLGDETNADATYGLDPDAGRKDISAVDTTTSGYHQEALVPLSSETHAGEDVSLHGSGPGAVLVNGTQEQSMIFHIMDFAADLVSKANEKVGS